MCARGMMESSECLLTVLYMFVFPRTWALVFGLIFYLVLSHVLKTLLYNVVI